MAGILKKDLTGQRFGKLTAKFIHSRTRNGHIRWHCACDCGAEKDIIATHLQSGRTISCGKHTLTGKDRKDWKGHGDISGQFWSQIKRSADGSKGRRILEFEITIEYAWNLLQAQEHRCALSGLSISLPIKWKDACTTSLDRIDSSKGYVEGNVQWVHKDINKMKNSFDQKYFIEMCRAVAGSCDV